jgi:hypothetical protein
MEISEGRRMRLLEDENARLKMIVARQALDFDVLKVVLSNRPRAEREAGGLVSQENGANDRPVNASVRIPQNCRAKIPQDSTRTNWGSGASGA